MLRKWVVVTATIVVVLVLFAGCGGTSRAQRLTIEVTTPPSRGQVTDGEVMVSGVVSDPGPTLTIGEETIAISSDGAFSHTVPLEYGANRISLRAEKEGFNAASGTINLTRALTLTILSPEQTIEISGDRVTVSGTVSDPTARVRITGSEVLVSDDGSFSYEVLLHYVATIINVTAQVAEADPVTVTLVVNRPEV